METEPANTQNSRHRVGSVVFGIVVGLAVATWSYFWLIDPDKRAERETQEAVVTASRAHLASMLALEAPEFVDPLSPQRRVGKVYIYPTASGWEVSGYYRRDDNDKWHAYLMTLDNSAVVASLRVSDAAPAVQERAAVDTRLEVLSDPGDGSPHD